MYVEHDLVPDASSGNGKLKENLNFFYIFSCRFCLREDSRFWNENEDSITSANHPLLSHFNMQ